MKASILINNYNYGRFLRQCIDSACEQTYDDVEVVVVDDEFNDGSIDIIKSYGTSITAIFKKNGGQASCFNAGFKRSQGDILFFLDADDAFHPDKVATVMKLYRSFKVQWCFDMVDLTGVPQITAPVSDTDVELCDFRASIARGDFPHVPIPTSGLSFERSLLRKILPMPIASGITLHDNYLKFASAGLGAGAICKVPLSYQRIHGDNRYTQSGHPSIRPAVMMETGLQLVRQFPFLSNIAIKLVSTAIATAVAGSLREYPLFLRPWRASQFTLAQRLRITALSMMKAVRIRLRQACRREGAV